MSILEGDMFNFIVVFTVLFLPVLIGEGFELFLDLKCYNKDLCSMCRLKNGNICKYSNKDIVDVKRCVTRKYIYEKEFKS